MFLQLLGYIWLNLSMSRSVLQTRLSASIDAYQKWCLSWLPQIWTPSIHLHSGRIGEWPIVIIERDKKSSQNSLVISDFIIIHLVHYLSYLHQRILVVYGGLYHTRTLDWLRLGLDVFRIRIALQNLFLRWILKYTSIRTVIIPK